ncbi:hypothetical protein [Thermofilum pendens]|uniref:Uncharacterized protein n=1 Tax=Thermofilum pendens (strain DSM 2475 / Hrk 5) TaxID=368408 RepID=A1RZR2_THEPD|nr:hypothetical protein [Thermofilum pendens]ABL78692.1 hypothetical protein Tpen_1294 [Thermofilum pendens Hrk 5]
MAGGAVVAAFRGRAPGRCRELSEPVNGWVWAECRSVQDLYAGLAEEARAGRQPSPVATPYGVLDPLDPRLEEACTYGRVGGAVKLKPSSGVADALKALLEVGATYAKVNGSIVEAEIPETPLEELLARGLVPLSWQKPARVELARAP